MVPGQETNQAPVERPSQRRICLKQAQEIGVLPKDSPRSYVVAFAAIWRLLLTWPGDCLSNSDRNQFLGSTPELPVHETRCQAPHQCE
jgi:hypothetical protein